MRYIPCWKQIGISKDRYLELLHFCRQYPQWTIEAGSMLGIQGMNMDGQPHGKKTGDSVSSAAERRERLLNKIGIVDQCARAVGKGEWYLALIQNVCIGKAYKQLDPEIMPSSNHSAFFACRRDFFAMLDQTIETK